MSFLRIVRFEWRLFKKDYIAWMLLSSLFICVTYALFEGLKVEQTKMATRDEFTGLENRTVEEFQRRNESAWQKINSGEIREIDEWTNLQPLTPLFWYWDFQY